jgi:lipopolysaccharide transport system ATP-binding protein
MSYAVKVNNLSKKYNIYKLNKQYLTFRDRIVDFFHKPRINYKKYEEFWALQDITFQVEPGEVMGIIGLNGAGKSTLLKILSKITPPTIGSVKFNGRTASLLEVGTGFHPELSGRDNIFLNGAILGMGREEIREKFDEIVEFSGISKFLDIPVKRYSSGMSVRLAFSIAVNLEPEILLLDEVLSVGDVELM